MATPYQPKVSDPRRVFGFGKQPLSDYFKVPKGAAFNPAFSPAAQEMLIEDEVVTRDRDAVQRQFEAEDAANDLLDRAPGMRDRQIQREVLRNPRILETPQYGTLNDFLQSRQQVRKPNPGSDKTLAPIFAEKITDPRRKADFQRRMVEDGLSFEEAKQAYYQDDFNEKQALQLAEAEIPEEEYAALQRDGVFDPTAVARRIAQAKREAIEMKRGEDPVDRKIELLTDALRTRQRVLDANLQDPAEDTLFMRYSQELDKAYEQKLSPPAAPAAPAVPTSGPIPLVPPGEGAAPSFPPVDTSDQKNPLSVVPPRGAPPVNLAEQAFIEGLVPEELMAREAAQRPAPESLKIQRDIDEAWTKGKQEIEDGFLKIYPDTPDDDYSQAVLAANAILSDKTIEDPDAPMPAMSEYGDVRPPRIRYLDLVLRKIGKKPNDVAFKEPHNSRVGGQEVKYTEALQEWAQDFLRAKKARAEAREAAATATPQTPLQKAAEEALKKLNSSQPPAQ